MRTQTVLLIGILWGLAASAHENESAPRPASAEVGKATAASDPFEGVYHVTKECDIAGGECDHHHYRQLDHLFIRKLNTKYEFRAYNATDKTFQVATLSAKGIVLKGKLKMKHGAGAEAHWLTLVRGQNSSGDAILLIRTCEKEPADGAECPPDGQHGGYAHGDPG